MKRAPDRFALNGFIVLVACLAVADRAGAASDYTLSRVQHGMELKIPDGRSVFEYLTKKPDNTDLTSSSAACFHPVNAPSGERITSIARKYHAHHRGIFFGWQSSEFYEPVTFGPNSPQTHPPPVEILQKLSAEWRGC